MRNEVDKEYVKLMEQLLSFLVLHATHSSQGRLCTGTLPPLGAQHSHFVIDILGLEDKADNNCAGCQCDNGAKPDGGARHKEKYCANQHDLDGSE